LEEFVRLIDLNIGLIRDLTGINQIADASTPNPEQSVGGSELAVAATNNALRPIYSGYIRLKEFTARKCALRVQLLVKHDKKAYEGYMPVVGRVGVKMLSIGADSIDANYFIKLEARPTEAMKQEIRKAAIAAMQPSRDGHSAIEYPDYLLINRALDKELEITKGNEERKTEDLKHKNKMEELTLEKSLEPETSAVPTP
jgi:hypothetical protein